MTRYSILIVDDHRILVDGLVSLFEKEPDFDVVGVAFNGREGLALAIEKRPDLIIADISMPEMNGIDMCRHINQQLPEAKILALSMHSSRQNIRDMLKAGAMGYVTKSSTYEELVRAIRSVLAGKHFFSAKILEGIVEEMLLSDMALPTVWGKLTDREREVAQLLAEGKSAKEISYLLNISIRTADSHKKNVFDKLNIDNIADLTRMAIREGLIDNEIH